MPAVTQLGEWMQNNETGTWLARDDDGQVLKTDVAGYLGTETSPDGGRPTAEASGSPRDRLAAARAEYDDRTARLGPAAPDYWGVWGSAVHDWEAEAG
jgi:hypothetical protein